VRGEAIGERILAWIDREGNVQRLNVPAKAYVSPRLSPDETKIVVATEERNGNAIWLYDVVGTSVYAAVDAQGK
jgi:hypothetical protein